MSLIKYDPDQLQKIVRGLPQYDKDVCGALTTFNQLRSFKLDIIEMLEWKDTIIKLLPKLEIPALVYAIDKMILGELPYDRNEGIQNIFNALKKIEKTQTGFRIMPVNQKF